MTKREQAIDELVRVTGRVLLVAFPLGVGARACDAEYGRAAARRNQAVEAWVSEHQAQPYPTHRGLIEQIEKAANRTGRTATASVVFNDPLAICRLLRAAATRSPLLFVGANMTLGVVLGPCLPFLPTPNEHDSYRAIVTVTIAE